MNYLVLAVTLAAAWVVLAVVTVVAVCRAAAAGDRIRERAAAQHAGHELVEALRAGDVPDDVLGRALAAWRDEAKRDDQ